MFLSLNLAPPPGPPFPTAPNGSVCPSAPPSEYAASNEGTMDHMYDMVQQVKAMVSELAINAGRAAADSRRGNGGANKYGGGKAADAKPSERVEEGPLTTK